MKDLETNPFVKSDFEESQARKKERFSELSKKNKVKAEDYYRESREAIEHIPFGQPILVGHHSESKHRNAISKANKKMDMSVEANKKSQYYQSKSLTVGVSGIASDDPMALQKLKDKLISLVENQEIMKLANKQYQAGGWPAVIVLSQELKDELIKNQERFSLKGKPFASYSLSNNSSEIRRIKSRIEQIENIQNSEPIEFENDEFRLGVDEGRIYIEFFQGKPSDECRLIIKSKAFRWSRHNTRWQRKVTNNAFYAAKRLLGELEQLDSCY